MANPNISFRLTPYQLARGLQVIRNLEPDFQLISLSQLVKVIYNDYLAKMTLGQNDIIDQSIMDEVESFVNTPSKKGLQINDLLNLEKSTRSEPTNDDKSIISSVSDFSPPEDWMED